MQIAVYRRRDAATIRLGIVRGCRDAHARSQREERDGATCGLVALQPSPVPSRDSQIQSTVGFPISNIATQCASRERVHDAVFARV